MPASYSLIIYLSRHVLEVTSVKNTCLSVEILFATGIVESGKIDKTQRLLISTIYHAAQRITNSRKNITLSMFLRQLKPLSKLVSAKFSCEFAGACNMLSLQTPPSLAAMSSASASRPYRSSKRNKPCDRCRETKTRCQVVTGSTCVKCQRSGQDCSFTGKSRPKAHTSIQYSDGVRTPTPATEYEHRPTSRAPWSQSPLMPVAVGRVSQRPPTNDTTLSVQPTPPSLPAETDLQFNTQFSQSLEGMRGHTAQLFGSSSESDPWLLRHCRFDDFGTRTFQSTQYRNAGGLPLAHKIPIHLLIEPDELHETAKDETRAYDKQISSRDELEHIVPLECGQRLVAL